ncbi:hypothetical protein BGZ74_008495 [Mortierella antarctica]|nr:hypothetical protein BGZ74_008495 [Mortierella antarctica]
MSASPVAKAPHVKLGKDTHPTKAPFRAGAVSTSKTSSPSKISTSSRVTSPPPTSPTSHTPNKRFSGIQSKVGSLEAIHYKPKPSEKKIQSFKQDFSHIKAKVDHSAPASIVVVATTTSSPTSPLGSPVHSPPTRPVRTTPTTSTSAAARLASRATPSTSRPVSMSVRTGGPQSAVVAAISLASPVHSPPSSRRSSASSTVASPPMSPTSATSRRLSKHIIPTQKVDYSSVKSKVGSLENVGYKSNMMQRPGSRGSSENGERGRSQSPGGQSSTSSSGNNSIGKAGGARRSSAPSTFKIPKSKKVDYSNVKSKVGSMEFVTHVPQGGNIRVFSEKLSFREQAQSKIAKEISITEFYQGDKSFDTLLREEEEEAVHGSRGNSEDGHVLDHDISEIYSDLDDLQDQQPPKSLLAVLEEVAENVGALELEEEQFYQDEQYQHTAVAH